MRQKISFVTGASGFVGSHLVKYLLDQGHEVHALLRASSDIQWIDGLDVIIHRGGIENEAFLNQTFIEFQPNYIFHIAGTVKSLDYQGFYRGNVQTTETILKASIGICSIEKIVITSSIAASSATTVGHPRLEDDPRLPLTNYGRSKVAQEDMAISYMDRLPIAIVRPPVVYGERDTEVLLFFKTVNWGLIPMIGFTNKSVSLVHVQDLVAGFFLVGMTDNSKGQTYFIGGHQDEYTWETLGRLAAKYLTRKSIAVRVPHFLVNSIAFLVEKIGRLFGQATVFNSDKASEMVSESWSCSSSKAKSELGYHPLIDIEKGFESTIKWYKKEGWI